MGIYDRDYYRQPAAGRSRLGGMNVWSVTTWLIVLNVAIYVIDALLLRTGLLYIQRIEEPAAPGGIVEVPFPPLAGLGHFSTYTAIWGLELWRFVTFQFLHAHVWHLFFNMLVLYFFGPMIESFLGARRFIAFYLLCGIAGPVLYLAFWALGILQMHPAVPMVGASAGIFGVLFAAARIAPNATVMLLIPPIPLKLKTLAWVLIGIALFTVFTHGPNVGGEAAHLGGAGMGYLLIRNAHWLSFLQRRRGGIRWG